MTAHAQRAKRIGRYELLCELGRGGMAELHLARLHGVGGFSRLVALKLILPHLTHDRTFVEQFLNEGRIAARLSHPNVCQVFELGESDGQLYLAMEYLEGVSWEHLAQALSFDMGKVLRFSAGVLAQACDGLQHAHDVPVIHRDVSPSNLFVTVNGVCKVLDFGVSKLLSEGKHTRTGVLKGKLPYMSPEQIEGTELDVRSDVFAAGVVVWEALARRRLFDRTTDFQIWKAITEEAVPPLDAFGPDVDRVVQRALARDREARYPSMRELANALREAAVPFGGAATADEIGVLVRDLCKDELAQRATLVRRVTSVEARPPEEPSATMSISLRGDSLVIDRPRRRLWPLLFAGALLAATVAIAVYATRSPAARVAALTPPPRVASQPIAVIDAAPEEIEMPAVDAAPIKKRATKTTAPKPELSPPVASSEAQDPGFFSIESKPFARIFVDGVLVDQTPMFRHRLKPGSRRIRAVLEDGREKTFTIKIVSGQEVNAGRLAW
jgi:serine/threonine-protein kinase